MRLGPASGRATPTAPASSTQNYVIGYWFASHVFSRLVTTSAAALDSLSLSFPIHRENTRALFSERPANEVTPNHSRRNEARSALTVTMGSCFCCCTAKKSISIPARSSPWQQPIKRVPGRHQRPAHVLALISSTPNKKAIYFDAKQYRKLHQSKWNKLSACC